MSTFLWESIAFGPIHSRRLGHSLGINLLPVDEKICTFNCLYCECGWTLEKNINAREPYPLEMVVEAIELLRSGLKDIVDTVWVVYADPRIRKTRMMQDRQLSEQEAEDRIASQWDDETYRARADRVIESTGGDVRLLYDQVDQALRSCL